MDQIRGLGTRFPASGSRWIGYVFVPDSPVVTRGFNLVVIALIVGMLVSAHLETRKRILENELVVSRPMSGSENIPQKPQGRGTVTRLNDYAGIAARNLFATTKGALDNNAGGQEEELVIEDMPLASLKLKLLGTVVASEAGMSTAIIAEANGRNEQMYREGESVKGAKVKKILRNAVVVNTGKRDEVLKMDTGKKANDKKNVPAPANSKRTIPAPVVTSSLEEAEKPSELCQIC